MTSPFGELPKWCMRSRIGGDVSFVLLLRGPSLKHGSPYKLLDRWRLPGCHPPQSKGIVFVREIRAPFIALISTSARTLCSPALIITGTDVAAAPSRMIMNVGIGALGAAPAICRARRNAIIWCEPRAACRARRRAAFDQRVCRRAFCPCRGQALLWPCPA